jgi:hypothetical protein
MWAFGEASLKEDRIDRNIKGDCKDSICRQSKDSEGQTGCSEVSGSFKGAGCEFEEENKETGGWNVQSQNGIAKVIKFSWVKTQLVFERRSRKTTKNEEIAVGNREV